MTSMKQAMLNAGLMTPKRIRETDPNRSLVVCEICGTKMPRKNVPVEVRYGGYRCKKRSCEHAGY